jgi:hypothetical protein
MLVGPFLAQADATIANVATPSIPADLDASWAALMFSQTLIGIRLNFSDASRVRAIGMYAIALLLGAVVGRILQHTPKLASAQSANLRRRGSKTQPDQRPGSLFGLRGSVGLWSDRGGHRGGVTAGPAGEDAQRLLGDRTRLDSEDSEAERGVGRERHGLIAELEVGADAPSDRP